MSADIDELRRLRRARDRMDREYAQPLDVPALARTALMSPGHFSRRFREAYSETPSAYRARNHDELRGLSPCQAMVLTRPRKAGAGGARKRAVSEKRSVAAPA